ncbi:MAG: HEAT repeat domain-containing protein [Planctomycetes bacterium]|nr:HEAT repeat domain-containing protein [Planctomycetota bacterium]
MNQMTAALGIDPIVASFPGEYSHLLLGACVTALFLMAISFAAAAVILRIRNERKAARRTRREAAWDPDLLDVISGNKEPRAVASRIAPRDREHFVDHLLRYAFHIRGDELRRVRDLAAPFLPDVVKRLARSDPGRRARAVHVLGTLGLPRYLKDVTAALDDPFPFTALVAARVLAQLGQPHRFAPVLSRLHRFENWSPGFLASLISDVGIGIAPDLRALAEHRERSARERAVAVEALARMNDAEAADVAARLLETETDRELMAACLRLLIRVGRIDHVPAVRRVFASEDFVLRAHAVSAMARLAGASAVPALQEALLDPSPWVALHAARGLLESRNLEPLQELAASDAPRSELAKQALAEGA